MSLDDLIILNEQRDAHLENLKLQRIMVANIESIIQEHAATLLSSDKGQIVLVTLFIALPVFKQSIAKIQEEVRKLGQTIIYVLKHNFPTMPTRKLAVTKKLKSRCNIS